MARPFRRACMVVLFAALAARALAGPASREQALAAAYPGAAIESERIFLTDRQMQRAESLSGEEISSPLIARYTAFVDGKIVGRAYVDTHVVRTKKESLLICLDSQGQVRRIEVTAFLEPPEYEAPEAWLNQYRGKGLTPDVHLDRGIRSIAGATLTAMAANRAVRRILAVDQVLAEDARQSRADR